MNSHRMYCALCVLSMKTIGSDSFFECVISHGMIFSALTIFYSLSLLLGKFPFFSSFWFQTNHLFAILKYVLYLYFLHFPNFFFSSKTLYNLTETPYCLLSVNYLLAVYLILTWTYIICCMFFLDHPLYIFVLFIDMCSKVWYTLPRALISFTQNFSFYKVF